MGAGKSTIGLILANTLGWDFLDLDAEIERLEGKKVAEIFKERGEQFFRLREKEVLKKSVEGDNRVISLGGGALNDSENLQFVKTMGKTIYLRSNPEKIYQRLRFKTDRPLFQTIESGPISREEALIKIKTILEEREKIYLQADIIVDSDKYPVGKTVDYLVKILNKKY